MPLGFPSAYQHINKVAEVTLPTISPSGLDYFVQGSRGKSGGAEGESLFQAFAVVYSLARSTSDL